MPLNEDETLLEKFDSVVAAPLTKFDAFPKFEPTYKARSDSRGIFTILVVLLTGILLLNDISDYIWGWSDQEFSVDDNTRSYMAINLDMTVAMPCGSLSVDLRDAVGDRLMLSSNPRRGVRRDGTVFDTSQATTLREHSQTLSARQILKQSRRSRGFFSIFSRKKEVDFKPTYNHQPDGSACRIYGMVFVKKVTANLHITALGHGYASYEHVDHNQMNLSHVISEFSFGSYFPDIAQPLDYTYELATDHFVAYQYYLQVVPTTVIDTNQEVLYTNQYSVTHYTRVLEHSQGAPGIFFKFDIDPMTLTIHQRKTTLLQLIIRCIGVVGGVFVCMGYAVRITTRAIDTVSGERESSIVSAEASGAKVGLRKKWGGNNLRERTLSGRMVRQGNGWVLEGAPGTPGSPYLATGGVGYVGTPLSASFSPGIGSGYPASPVFGQQQTFPPSTPGTPVPGSTGFPASFGPPPRSGTGGTPRTNGGALPPPSPALGPNGSHHNWSNAMPPPSPGLGLGLTGVPGSPAAMVPPRRFSSGSRKDD